MHRIQYALIASTAAFLSVVKGIELEFFPFFETLAQDDSVFIVQHGPYNFSASCDSTAVRLDVLVQATQEDYIFSDQGIPVNLAAGDTESYDGVFRESHYGNDYADGGFVSASGYYLGWNGQSVIGLHIADGGTQPLFGDNVNCVIAGVVKLIEE